MRNLEYCMLHEVKPVGPILGFLADREIFESVVDQFGRMFEIRRRGQPQSEWRHR